VFVRHHTFAPNLNPKYQAMLVQAHIDDLFQLGIITFNQFVFMQDNCRSMNEVAEALTSFNDSDLD
jgi:hypothetical protein